MVVRRTVLKAIAGTSVATVFAGKLTCLSAVAADAARCACGATCMA